jgi:predicted extracellular nuclease
MIILFYNVENLFDFIDDPVTRDEEYLPRGAKKWTKTRYRTKIDHIAAVIAAPGKNLPVIAGITEIENDRVLNDLIQSESLHEGNYGFIHYESKDERGIDVAMLYRKDFFKPLYSKPIPIVFPFDPDDKTRDILYVKGVFRNNDIVHFFVNHWPSRREGVKETEPRRNHSAMIVRSYIDRILAGDPEARIIVMGDFNDPPDSHSIKTILRAENPRQSGSFDLYNLAYPLFLKRYGTINHKGKWLLFDQIMVSAPILDRVKGIHANKNSFRIFEPNWLLFTHPRYHDKQPDKTYSGNEYHGGYSDHLPVYVTIAFSDGIESR